MRPRVPAWVLDSLGILYGEEIKGARKVLTAAALTYVAAVVSTALQVFLSGTSHKIIEEINFSLDILSKFRYTIVTDLLSWNVRHS